VLRFTTAPTHALSQVKQGALDIVQGLTGSPDGIDKLKTHIAKLLGNLLRLANDSTETSKPALTCLVNLSQDIDMSRKLLEVKIVPRVMDYIRERTCPHPELLVRATSQPTCTCIA
jgi:hypothetical protein